MEVLREEGTDGVRYALWNVSGWHRDYSPPAWRSRATEEQKRTGWEMAVRIEKPKITIEMKFRRRLPARAPLQVQLLPFSHRLCVAFTPL